MNSRAKPIMYLQFPDDNSHVRAYDERYNDRDVAYVRSDLVEQITVYDAGIVWNEERFLGGADIDVPEWNELLKEPRTYFVYDEESGGIVPYDTDSDGTRTDV